jgi:1,4-dihydroxy-6-naphthoate synthase
MDPALADQFVGMYVNHHTVDGGEIVVQAAQKLLDLGYEAGLIPLKTTVEVVR